MFLDDAARASCRPRWATGRAVSQSGARTWRLPLRDLEYPFDLDRRIGGKRGDADVVRAWRPLSPNAATIRSEAPLSTFGPSRKSGAELTKPPSRTTRTTLSRSPRAALI